MVLSEKLHAVALNQSSKPPARIWTLCDIIQDLAGFNFHDARM